MANNATVLLHAQAAPLMEWPRVALLIPPQDKHLGSLALTRSWDKILISWLPGPSSARPVGKAWDAIKPLFLQGEEAPCPRCKHEVYAAEVSESLKCDKCQHTFRPCEPPLLTPPGDQVKRNPGEDINDELEAKGEHMGVDIHHCRTPLYSGPWSNEADEFLRAAIDAARALDAVSAREVVLRAVGLGKPPIGSSNRSGISGISDGAGSAVAGQNNVISPRVSVSGGGSRGSGKGAPPVEPASAPLGAANRNPTDSGTNTMFHSGDNTAGGRPKKNPKVRSNPQK